MLCTLDAIQQFPAHGQSCFIYTPHTLSTPAPNASVLKKQTPDIAYSEGEILMF